MKASLERRQGKQQCRSQVIDGYQNFWHNKGRVRERLGWHASLDKCPHCSTSERAASGTSIRWSSSWIWNGALGLTHRPLNLPGCCPDDAGWWEDRLGCMVQGAGRELAGQSVGLRVSGPRLVGDHEVKPVQEEGPAHLPGV